MAGLLLVTGAAGNVGAETARCLLAQEMPVRLADLDPAALSARFGARAECVRLDFTDPATYAPALRDVNGLFLVRPPQLTNMATTLVPFLRAAEAAGVRRVAFLSLIGIERNPRVPHAQVEAALRASSLAWTFLRCSFFMQNLSGQHRDEIRLRDELDIPAGDSRTSFIDTRDIGAVAARVLTESGHAQQAYDLTGPEALSYPQVAQTFTRVLGRPIRYRNPSPAGFVLRRVLAGTPLPFALVMSMLYRETRAGMAATVTGEVKRLLDRDPISLEQFVSDHRSVWQR